MLDHFCGFFLPACSTLWNLLPLFPRNHSFHSRYSSILPDVWIRKAIFYTPFRIFPLCRQITVFYPVTHFFKRFPFRHWCRYMVHSEVSGRALYIHQCQKYLDPPHARPCQKRGFFWNLQPLSNGRRRQNSPQASAGWEF